jgi:putative hydrolase of the HAD superfamily
MIMQIRAITFDLWDTIYEEDVVTDKLRKEKRYALIDSTLKEAGNSIEQNKLSSVLLQTETAAKREWTENHRTMGANESMCLLLSLLSMELNSTQLDRLSRRIEDITIDYPPTPFPEAQRVLSTLAQKFSLGLISDTGLTPGRVLRNMLAKDNLLQYFDVLTFSNELGSSKPHKIAFENTLKGLNALPHEAIHIGDNENTDVIGALNSGMRVIHLAKSDSIVYGNESRYHRVSRLEDILKHIDHVNLENELPFLK